MPEVLLGGNHADILAWRREQSLELTLARRPELLDAAPLEDGDRAMLARLARARETDEGLRALGLSFERLELRLADQWPKRWLAAFVPEANRKAAKKQCLPGRRHVGWLWQAFSMGFIPEYLEGDAAEEGWRRLAPGACMLYLPERGLLYRVGGGIDPEKTGENLGGFILADADMKATYLRAGRAGPGPFFAGKA